MDGIEKEYVFAHTAGWMDAFSQSGGKYVWPTALLMGIASRETNMKNIVGDGGHGYGVMQVDDRTDPSFCHSGAWQDAKAAIARGVEILESKRTLIGRSQGQIMYVGGMKFTGARFATQELLNRVSVACYNAGLWPYYSFSTGQDIDRWTTGRDYSSDVLRRAAEFEKLLVK